MKPFSLLKPSFLLAALVAAHPGYATSAEPQVLVKVGQMSVTASDLESAMASSPFASQFPSLDRDAQGELRGGMLQRLVAARLLTLEAKRLGLDQTPEFEQDVNTFKQGLLYRHFMDRLREGITVPADIEAAIEQQNPDDPDAMDAARSAYLSDAYRSMRYLTVQNLRKKYHVNVHEDRIQPNRMRDDIVLLEGDGISINYADIVSGQVNPPQDKTWMLERLYQLAELQVIAKAAEEAHVDVADRVESYRQERLPAMLIEAKQKEWTSDGEAVRRFYDEHPEFGRTLERWHIGQIVLSSREQAEAIRQRILAGESLFVLAGEHSIDPHGRKMHGDMGWVKEGSGYPAIEQAISGLEDNQISEVIQTPMGFHLVTILERSPSLKRSFASVRDKVEQTLITKLTMDYMNELSARHKVEWTLVDNQAKQQRMD